MRGKCGHTDDHGESLYTPGYGCPVCQSEDVNRLRAEVERWTNNADNLAVQVKDLKDQQARLIEEQGYAFQKAMNEQIEENRKLRAENATLEGYLHDIFATETCLCPEEAVEKGFISEATRCAIAKAKEAMHWNGPRT